MINGDATTDVSECEGEGGHDWARIFIAASSSLCYENKHFSCCVYANERKREGGREREREREREIKRQGRHVFPSAALNAHAMHVL